MPVQDADYPEDHIWVYDPESHESRLAPIEDAGQTANDAEPADTPDVD